MRFLHISLGSACELKYLSALAAELGYPNAPRWADVLKQCDAVVRQLERLVQSMEQMASREATTRKADHEPRTPPETGDRRPESPP